MSAVDIDRYRFDFDLTLAFLLANADGTVYHRIGGRTWRDPLAWMSMDFVAKVMRDGRATHRAHQADVAAGRVVPPPARRTVYDIETFAKKIARQAKKPSCIHCHTVHDAEIRHAQAKGTFRPRDRFVWPEPARVGLTMQRKDQALVAAVAPASIAARSGLRVGDRLLRLGAQRILTVHDIQWVLHRAPWEGGAVPMRFLRAGKEQAGKLQLTEGFKVADPLTYSWRSYKWSLRPAPGFGGPELNAKAKARLGLAKDAFAFRVQYIVDWGERPQQGRENRRQGLRKGDIVYSYAGKRDFENVPHFHAWVRLTQRRGDTVAIELIRRGERKTIRVKLQ